MKGLTDLVEHLVYETLALLLPGTVLVVLAIAVVFPDAWQSTVEFGDAHPWVAVGVGYLAGFFIQSLSRPVCNVGRWLLGVPYRVLLAGIGRVGGRTLRSRVEAAVTVSIRWLRSGHSPGAEDRNEGHVRLADVEDKHWRARLGISADKQIRRRDLLDLSFSGLGDERRRLARFRALTSLCRAIAALAAIAGWVLVGAIIGPWPLTGAAAATGLAVLILFVAFLERADMYDRLWSAIITPQFLANVSAGGSLRGTAPSAVRDLAWALHDPAAGPGEGTHVSRIIADGGAPAVAPHAPASEAVIDAAPTRRN